MERTTSADVGGAEVRFASVEGLLVLKLVAPATSKTPAACWPLQPDADLAYVRRWLAEFDAALGLATVAVLDRLVAETAG